MKLGKKKKAKKVNWKKICDDLWADLIKAKAGYKSEYSGKLGKKAGGEEILHSHHIVGKPNFRLRYELDNGISLTAGEHKFIAHHTGRQEMFRVRVKEIKGQDIYEKLNLLSRGISKVDYKTMFLYLKEQLMKVNNG